MVFKFISSSVMSVWKSVINYFRSVFLVFSLKGPPAYPLLGNILLAKDYTTVLELARNVRELYGSIVGGWMSLIPFLYIFEPRHLKIILGSSKNSRKNFFYRIIHNFVGAGLITNDGESWRKNRKLIQPYFHINELEKYIAIFNEKGKQFIEQLPIDQDIQISKYINNCILDLLHYVILGVPIEDGCPYREGGLTVHSRVLRPWLLLEPVFRYTGLAKEEKNQMLSLRAYTEKIVMKRKAIIGNSEPQCLLDMFLKLAETNSNFDFEDVLNETVTFMLAGQDSVGSSLAFTLFHLAKNEDAQKKVIEEISDILLTSDSLTLLDLNKMKYMDQVIKESLRLTPSIPIISRILTEDVELDGLVIPEGTNLLIGPFSTQRLPDFYPDPSKFDPDRFSEENVSKLHPYAFLPFSMGPRNCIGYKFATLEMKTIMYYLFKKFTISTVPGKDELVLCSKVTIRAKGGIWVRLNLRE